MSATPTPRPWTIEHGTSINGGFWIMATLADGQTGVVTGRAPWPLRAAESSANAHLIVQAVNLHDDLLAALRAVVEFKPFDRRFDHSGAMNATRLGDHEAYLRLRATVRAVLARADAGQE